MKTVAGLRVARENKPTWAMRRVVCLYTIVLLANLFYSLAHNPAWAANAPLASTSQTPSLAAKDSNPRWSGLSDSVFQHVNGEHGLPHAFVTALTVDQAGFLWAGTQDGLARWDGYRFKVYLPNPKDNASLPGVYVQSLHTDSNGRLWVGTNGGGLARYDSTYDRFLRIGVGPRGVSHGQILAIEDDGSGGIWVGTWDGLDHFNADEVKLGLTASHFRHDPAQTGSLPASRVRALLLDRQKRLWVGTSKGLAWRDPDSGRFIAVPLPTNDGDAAAIFSLAQSSDGKIWVGSADDGVFSLDPDTRQAQALPQIRDPLNLASPVEPIVWIREVQHGQIWIGTKGHGIAVLDSHTLHTRWLHHEDNKPGSLASDALYSIAQDRSGLVWIGGQSGLSRIDPFQTTVQTLLGTGSNGLRDANITHVVPMPDGSIWLGTQIQGIHIVNPAASQIRQVKTGSTIAPGYIHAISQPVQGNVFVGAHRGLYRSDLAGQQFERLALKGRDINRMTRALLVEGNTLWMTGDDGLWQIDLSTSQPSQPGQPAQPLQARRVAGAAQLDNAAIGVMLRGPDGRLWLGSTNRGLFRLDTQTHELLAISPDLSDPHALASSAIASILFDSRGRLWLGTAGGGLHLWAKPTAPGKPQFQRITMTEGLPNNSVDCLLEDGNGNIWASTDGGLAQIDGRTLAVQGLLRADGTALSAFWGNSGNHGPDGELLFGGVGGLTVLNPGVFQPWSYSPPVVVTRVQVGGAEVLSGNAYRIEPQANRFALEFSALDFSAPERNRYAYKLEGYDQDWISTDASRRLASYQNLPPGTYFLNLRGSNRNGQWATQQGLVTLQVLPAWYQTWWWYVLLLLLALGLAYTLVQARTRLLRLRQYALASQVRQRTLALRQQKMELEQANQQLQQANLAAQQAQAQLVQQEKMASLGGLVAGIAHQINTPLGTTLVAISGAATTWRDLQEAIKTGQISKSLLIERAAEGVEYTDLALRTANRAAELIAVFKAIAVNPDHDFGSAHALDLALYLEELGGLIQGALEQQGCRLEVEVEAGLTLEVVQEALTEVMTRILVNVIDHAFIGGRVGSVRLAACSNAAGEVEISVCDTGHGIAPEHLPKVFDPFFSTRSGLHGHVGLGLHVAYNHVLQTLQGRIVVTSTLGQGTCVTIYLKPRGPANPVG